METQLEQQDVDLMVKEIRRFCQQQLAPKVERPEVPLSQEQLQQVTQEAIELGFLNSSNLEEGFGLWSAPQQALGMELSVGLLLEMASVNSGVALYWHHAALSQWLTKQLGWQEACSENTALIIQGHYGIGRHSLSKYLQDKPLDTEEKELLKDCYGFEKDKTGRVLHTTKDWKSLLIPVVEDNDLQWKLFTASQVLIKEHPHSHGFDELQTYSIHYKESPEQTSKLSHEDSVQLFQNLLKLDALGLMTIALGALAQGRKLADTYADLRQQGGQLIASYPAVQQMLASIHSVCTSSKLQLFALCQKDIAHLSLPQTLQVRTMLHPAVCNAANQVMQLHGGSGYMQDTGAEKLVRNVNQLRLMHGTPTELQLFLSEWR